MIWLSNFNNFSLLEKYGTPEFSKQLSTDILANIFKNNFNSFIQPVNYSDIFNIKSIDVIILNIKKDFSVKIYPKNKNPFNIVIEFDIPIEAKNSWSYLHELIIHELTHLYEFYNLVMNNRKLPLYNKIKKGLINTINQDNIDIIAYFRNLIYLTLDNELNARVSQTYIYLKNTKLKEKDNLINALSKSSAWKKMLLINNFNPKQYINELINELGETFSIFLINQINEEIFDNLNIKLTKITNYNEMLTFSKKWKKKFNYKLLKHKQKLLKLTEQFEEKD